MLSVDGASAGDVSRCCRSAFRWCFGVLSLVFKSQRGGSLEVDVRADNFTRNHDLRFGILDRIGDSSEAILTANMPFDIDTIPQRREAVERISRSLCYVKIKFKEKGFSRTYHMCTAVELLPTAAYRNRNQRGRYRYANGYST